MPIDRELRKTGIGSTDISAILGMNPWKSPFDVYAEKTGLLDDVIEETNARMKMGKLFERTIAQCYEIETGKAVLWLDMTKRSVTHPLVVWTPDAVCVDERIGVDCKRVGLDQSQKWGEPGTDQIPDHIAIQAHWFLLASGLERWDIAALIGDGLRIYEVPRDEDLEGSLLEAGERFWQDHILAGIPPEITSTATSEAWLRKRFPLNTEQIREANAGEAAMLRDYRTAYAIFDSVQKAKDDLEIRVKTAIGEADGITANGIIVTYKRAKDIIGVDWKALGKWAASDDLKRYEKRFTGVVRNGSRRIHKKF